MHLCRCMRGSRRAGLRFGLLLVVAAGLLARGAVGARAQAAPVSNVYTWGWNYYGQLGDGTTAERSTAAAAAAPADAVVVAAGAGHSLALKADGTVVAWGDNFYGELGEGTQSNRLTPVPVQDPADPSGFLTDVAAVAAGNSHSLALTTDGTVMAWGDNFYGELGDGTQYHNRLTPVPVQDPADPTGFLTNVSTVAAGYGHSLAVTADGTVMAWGSNGEGELGDGTSGNSRLTPVPVRDPSDPSGFLNNVTAVAGGYLHSLAVKADGTVVAWGGNANGQLGDGTYNSRLTPVPVRDPSDPTGFLTNVVTVAAGYGHSVAVKADGTVVAWGWNFDGELGDGTTTTRPAPVPVQDPADPTGFLTNVSTVAAGTGHNLALKADGTVAAWGWNSAGQSGDGTQRNNRLTAVYVQDPADPSGLLTEVAVIAAGGLHSLAVKNLPVPDPCGESGRLESCFLPPVSSAPRSSLSAGLPPPTVRG